MTTVKYPLTIYICKSVDAHAKKENKMKKTIIIAAIVLLAVSFVFANGSQEDSGKAPVLRVATMPLTAGVPVQYAADHGFFEEEGLNVQIDYYATGAPINEAIAAKEADIACSGFASVYSLANADCIWLADINTTGGMGIYARPDSVYANAPETNGVKGSKEIVKGAKILEPLGTVAQYMTEGYAELFGLTNTEITQVNMEWAPAYQAFITGQGDLTAANPPYSYKLDSEGYVRVGSFEDICGVQMVDGCFGRRSVVESRTEEVTKFVKCLVKAMDALQNEEVRYEYMKEFYALNGSTFSDYDVRMEIKDRAFVGTDYMSKPEYKIGEAWVAITDFLVRAEKITEKNAPNVAASINNEIISKATGLNISK